MSGAILQGLHGVFIAGTDTGVGKTRVAVALLQALASRDIAAIGVKPVATGLDAAGVNEDVALLHAASCTAGSPRGAGGGLPQTCGAPLEFADINPYSFSPPISPHLAARRAGVIIEPTRITAACARLAPRCELLIVEGTGGWLAPISEQLCMAQVARALGLPVVLVVGLRLGCLSHALLTAAAIAADQLPLAGWIGTVLDPHMLALEENIASLRERLPAPLLGLLAHSSDRSEDATQLAAAAARAAEAARGARERT
jgi:dethiobiotin synthetase